MVLQHPAGDGVQKTGGRGGIRNFDVVCGGFPSLRKAVPLLHRGQDLFRLPVDLLAGAGQRDALLGAVKNRKAQFLFQAVHGVAQRRLRDKKICGGACDGSAVCNGNEKFQLFDSHNASPFFTRRFRCSAAPRPSAATIFSFDVRRPFPRRRKDDDHASHV